MLSRPALVKPIEDRDIFSHLYPSQVEIEIVFEAEEAIPFQPLVRQLSFIRSPRHWRAYFQGVSMRELGEADFAVLHRALLSAR